MWVLLGGGVGVAGPAGAAVMPAQVVVWLWARDWLDWWATFGSFSLDLNPTTSTEGLLPLQLGLQLELYLHPWLITTRQC